jgi:hypothetical protein
MSLRWLQDKLLLSKNQEPKNQGKNAKESQAPMMNTKI